MNQQAQQSSTSFSFRDIPLPVYIIAGTIIAALAALYIINPYASGYGAYLVTVLYYANNLWGADNGDWTHCYIVPFAAAAMVWSKRRVLHLSDIRSSWIGFGLTIFALLVYFLGFRADNIYIGYASFQLLTAGLLLWVCGWKWFGHLVFAWAFLVFLYPLPFLDNLVAFPLRMVMSDASVHALNIIGIPSIKSGTAILSAPDLVSGLKTGARFSVDVANPCSGIRSLFALMMVSALYGYFTQPGIWRKIVLFLCSIPLAVLGNLARILMLTIGTITLGAETAIGTLDDPSFFHMLAGYFVFIVALAGMIAIGKLLNYDWEGLIARWKSADHTPAAAASGGNSYSNDNNEY